MSTKTVRLWILLALTLIPLLMTETASAGDDRFSIRLWGLASPKIIGQAGSGNNAPGYGDAYKTGFGLGGELAYRFCNRFSGVGGLGYEYYGGDSYRDISFEALKMFPVYIGGKFHIIPKDTILDMYLRLDVGVAYLSAVNVSYMGLKERYWDPTWAPFVAAGLGAEYRWGSWGVSLDVKVRYMGAPSSAMGESSNSENFWSIPITVGLNYHF